MTNKVLNWVKSIWTNKSVEPTFFLFALAQGFYLIVAKNLYIDKVCTVNLNYTQEICDNIQDYEDEQIKVQQYVSELQTYNKILQAIPACIYSLFAGPWSDRHGRKTLIICSAFGYIFNNAVFIINTYFWYELKAEYLLFECLQDCTGGYVCFYLACYSYIADVTEPEDRTKRLALMDGLWPLGFYIGNGSSGVIKVRHGYMVNFALGMLFCVSAMAYTFIFVPDSRPVRDARIARDAKLRRGLEPEEKTGGMALKTQGSNAEKPIEKEVNKNPGDDSQEGNLFKSLFNVKNLRDAWRSLLKKREGHKRLFIILLILAFELEIFLSQGRWSSLFLFFKKHLKWTAIDYSRYITILGVMGMLAQYLVVPVLSQRFKFHDCTISLIDAMTSFVNCFVIAFCVNEWMLYIGAAFSILDATSTTMFRSLLTKYVEPDEVGKIFSIVGTFQALLPFASGPVFGFLYRDTVAFLPSAFLLVVAGFKLIEGVVVLIVFVGVKRDQRKMKAKMMMAEAATPQEFKAFLPNSKKDSEEEAEVQTEKVARDQD